jgi:steroid 5-alpha reductase family enzyme
MLTWWSIYLLALPALSPTERAVAVISPLFVTFLLMKLSGVPLLERAADAKYKGNSEYEAYKRKTHVIVPFGAGF